MDAPLIGITTYARDERARFSSPTAYADAIRRAGGLVVLVPPGDPRPAELLDRLDGILFAGGGDIAPSAYGGANHKDIYNVDEERDRTEIALARKAAGDGVPTLGICRGTQVINVALGGTLIEHLPDVVGRSVLHRLPPREPTSHPVEVKEGSRLAGVLGGTDLAPVSWHHQAIRKAVPSLEPVAWAPDGTIEAVEMRSHPWLLAVQWHPELAPAGDAAADRLFQAFVRGAAERRAKSGNLKGPGGGGNR